MSSDFFDIAWINFTKAILFGRREDDSEFERVLTDAERERVYDLNERHDRETKDLLRELAGAA